MIHSKAQQLCYLYGLFDVSVSWFTWQSRFHEFRLVEKYRWIWFLPSNEIDVVVEHLRSDMTTRVDQQQRTIYLQIADGKSSGGGGEG